MMQTGQMVLMSACCIFTFIPVSAAMDCRVVVFVLQPVPSEVIVTHCLTTSVQYFPDFGLPI